MHQVGFNTLILSFFLLMACLSLVYCTWVLITSSVHLKKLIESYTEVYNLLGPLTTFDNLENKIYNNYQYNGIFGSLFSGFFNYKIPFSELFYATDMITGIILIINLVILLISFLLLLYGTVLSGYPLSVTFYIQVLIFLIIIVAHYILLIIKSAHLTNVSSQKTKFTISNNDYVVFLIILVVLEAAVIIQLLIN
ncbi:amino acid transporter [Methanococcus maripaludis]|uniref:Amino acid transporter n=1 Tax=Methanococcus maripaludis TaxID=39152 RepID=A0A7J9P0J8_METMI|nr:amino acid transporter [Methanococcus maripaludis]